MTVVSSYGAERTYEDQITRTRVFSSGGIVWVGEISPSESESSQLWEAIQKFKTDGVEAGIKALDQFVAAHPQSQWTPSLQAHLGKWHREHGRFTLALKYWESAWNSTKSFKGGQEKGIADLTLAHWASLSSEPSSPGAECDPADDGAGGADGADRKSVV